MAISGFVIENVPPLADVWQMQMGESIWAFNQIDGLCGEEGLTCYPYLQRHRDEIEMAMSQAYKQMTKSLGYFPSATFAYQDYTMKPSPSRSQALSLRTGHVMAFGKRVETVVSAASNIVYSKSDSGLAYDDIATITVADGGLSPAGFRLKFLDADVPYQVGDGSTVIPSRVTDISDGNATIKAHRARFVRPDLWFEAEPNSIDPAVASAFVTQVAVIHETVDQSIPAEVLDKTGAVISGITLEIVPTDMRRGEFIVKPFSTTETDYVTLRVYYFAGQAGVWYQMDSQFAKSITRFANTLMQERPHPFRDDVYETWLQDRTRPKDVMQDTPFGDANGAVAAYQAVDVRRLLKWSAS